MLFRSDCDDMLLYRIVYVINAASVVSPFSCFHRSLSARRSELKAHWGNCLLHIYSCFTCRNGLPQCAFVGGLSLLGGCGADARVITRRCAYRVLLYITAGTVLIGSLPFTPFPLLHHSPSHRRTFGQETHSSTYTLGQRRTKGRPEAEHYVMAGGQLGGVCGHSGVAAPGPTALGDDEIHRPAHYIILSRSTDDPGGSPYTYAPQTPNASNNPACFAILMHD